MSGYSPRPLFGRLLAEFWRVPFIKSSNMTKIAQAQTNQAPAPPAPTPPSPAAPPPTAPAPAAPQTTGQTGVQTQPPGGSQPSTPDTFTQIIPLLFITLIVYFIVLRPQQRQTKAQKEALKNLRRGDTVVTSGGLVGKITKIVDDNEIEAEIAQNVRVRVLRRAVSEVRAKGEPVKEQAAAGR